MVRRPDSRRSRGRRSFTLQLLREKNHLKDQEENQEEEEEVMLQAGRWRRRQPSVEEVVEQL